MIDVSKVTEPRRYATLLLSVLGMLAAHTIAAQTTPSLGSDSQERTPPSEWTAQTAADLEEIVGPIALYPDDLVAIVLPASTFPLQIVQAARYLEQRESAPNLQPDEAWDESVVALLNYPEALALLNDDLDWTWTLGEAVIYQQGDVLDAIQTFRDRAYAAGNLESDSRQTITNNGDTIIIAPAEPEVVYVPYYDPAYVVARQTYPVYHYYPRAYPVYYYPYPAGYSFGSGFFWGVTTAFAVGWQDHFLHVHHHSRYGHPYYGRPYYLPFYARSNVYVGVSRIRGNDRWQPGYRHGGRPGREVDYRLRDRAVANARYETLAREGRLPRTARRAGRLAANDAGVNERQAQPRHRIRQADGVPPTSRNRVVTNEPRSGRAPVFNSQRASASTIRTESRYTRPRNGREDTRAGVVSSTRARIAGRTAQPGIRTIPRPSTSARGTAAQPRARMTQSNVTQREQPVSRPATQAHSAWRGAKNAGKQRARTRGDGQSGNRGDRVMSSSRQLRRAR